MASIVLHIGTHKTATTTIQALFRERANILAEHGIVYPQLENGNAHHICAGTRKSWSSEDNAKSGSQKAYEILVNRYADSQDTIFLSSEENGYFALCVGGLVSGHSTSFPYVVR